MIGNKQTVHIHIKIEYIEDISRFIIHLIYSHIYILYMRLIINHKLDLSQNRQFKSIYNISTQKTVFYYILFKYTLPLTTPINFIYDHEKIINLFTQYRFNKYYLNIK